MSADIKAEQVTDIWTANIVNARTGRNDGAWWRPILVRNRQMRAEDEARSICKRFGDISHIDRSNKERLARIVNDDMLDLLRLEALAGPSDQQGNRPSSESLQVERKTKTRITQIEAATQRVQRSSNVQPTSLENQDETDTEGQSSQDKQEVAVSKTLGLDHTSQELANLGTKAALGTEIQPSNDAATNKTAGTSSDISGLSVESLGIEDTREGVHTVELAGFPQESEVEGAIQVDDVVPVAATICEIDVSQSPFTSAVSVSDTFAKKTPYSITSSKVSAPSEQQLDTISTGSGVQSVQSPYKDTSNTPQVNLQESNTSRHALHSLQAVTPPDTISENLSTQNDADTANSKELASVNMASTYPQGLNPSDQNVNTRQQDIQAPVAVPYHTAFPRGWNNIKWTYRTHTSADLELQTHGIWLFDRPKTFQTQQGNSHLADLAMRHTRVIVLPHSQPRNTPSYLSDGQTLVVFPHSTPWQPDQRSAEYTDAVTPNYTSATRLTEYQALEALGCEVWRHDRQHLPCTNPACQKLLSDHVKETLICLGCGPKSTTRYCSQACRFKDSYRHGQDCGLPHHLIRTIVDDGTAPPRFSHLFPSIRERHGIRTHETYRQRTFAEMSAGQYTLFDPATGEPTTLVWFWRFSGRQEVPHRGYGAEMEARIERCLNIALFDQSQTTVLEYLFRLLQQSLRIKGASQAIARVLVTQFAREFGFVAQISWRITSGQPMCECEWAGDGVLALEHSSSCKLRYRGVGELFRGRQRCLMDLIEAMEAKHWILRAWRTRHPTESDWQRRIAGHGFPGCIVPAGWLPRFGKGWEGCWASEDDVCG